MHGDLLEAIQFAITRLGKTIDSITIDDLAPVDEFNIGGRMATERLIDQLDFSTQDHVVDVGCGLGGALSMPFEDKTFDGGYMMHVGMNIEDKAQLFKEIYRGLRPGSCFGVYDVMRHNEGELAYPVPWAAAGTCNLATLDIYRQALVGAGFEIVKEENRRDFALEFFKQLRAKSESSAGPPPLGLHTLMQDSTAGKIKNMIDNITDEYIAPVEIVAKKL